MKLNIYIYIQNDIKKKRIAIKWMRMNFEEKKEQTRGWIISN